VSYGIVLVRVRVAIALSPRPTPRDEHHELFQTGGHGLAPPPPFPCGVRSSLRPGWRRHRAQHPRHVRPRPALETGARGSLNRVAKTTKTCTAGEAAGRAEGERQAPEERAAREAAEASVREIAVRVASLEAGAVTRDTEGASLRPSEGELALDLAEMAEYKRRGGLSHSQQESAVAQAGDGGVQAA
jgi:hypothetical protein